MDRASRCVHCGKGLVPTPSFTGRTELKCVFCDGLDPMKMEAATRWASSPLATPPSAAEADAKGSFNAYQGRPSQDFGR